VERLFRVVVLDSQQWTIKKAHNRSQWLHAAIEIQPPSGGMPL
jgi:hypothetical protein